MFISTANGEAPPWPVFANPETGKPYVETYYAWNAARRHAGLAGFRVHDLRNSFASLLINAGRSLYEVQKMLGQTPIERIQRYSHIADETLLAAAITAAEALGGALVTPSAQE
ncbi:tyrosine-type recombinase/integrase [Pseudomonas sp. PS01300]|uniref:tyrosine-type recombinase/integrase n=1 Tax=Pseudomonas sp. PS01300 TaxID=2991436 RepID=UPI00249CD382|nr:tyrosine-type recombinase/integrase [Pseudomonas sp. PS01300]